VSAASTNIAEFTDAPVALVRAAVSTSVAYQITTSVVFAWLGCSRGHLFIYLTTAVNPHKVNKVNNLRNAHA